MGEDKPDETHGHPHRSAGEEIEWIGAEVEARPKVMFWGTIAVAVVVAAALIIFIVVQLTGS
jgi:cobalamin biosynthesis protein CobD/CbiB